MKGLESWLRMRSRLWGSDAHEEGCGPVQQLIVSFAEFHGFVNGFEVTQLVV